MAALAVAGFRLHNPCFPCNYFSLNATSLTLLGVATKLTTDLNTNMVKSTADWFPKHISSIFMSTSLCHLSSSLGSMNHSGILTNTVAAGILAITVVDNMWIQLVLLWNFLDSFLILNILPTALLMITLIALISLAIAVPSIKRGLEAKYEEMNRVALMEAFTYDHDQKGRMMKYWVMAESSSPQFLISRSVVSIPLAVICLLDVILLAVIYGISFVNFRRLSLGRPESVYGGYTIWVLVIQSIGIVVGAISPMFRWFVAVSFRCSSRNRQRFGNPFKVEGYWIETLLDWRDSSSSLPMNLQDKYMRCVLDVRWFAVTFCIGLQIFTVLLSKLLLILSALLISVFSLCFGTIKKMMNLHLDVEIGQESAGGEMDLNLSHYVLLLEGEAELPRRILKNICLEADNMIQRGKQKQPKNLVHLLRKFNRFKGVGEFDSDRIPCLQFQEPPNIWMLPVVTLATIAVALPNIAKHKRDHLLNSSSEGLSLVEKKLDKDEQLVSIRKSACVTWIGVAVYMKWLDIDLRMMSRNCKNSKEVVREFARKAEKRVMDSGMQSWSSKAVSSHSMYRISRTSPAATMAVFGSS